METLNEYQKEAARTDTEKPLSSLIENGLLGMAGEVGECCDIMKKYLYQEHEFDREHLIEELGDVLWYVAQTARGLNVSLEYVAEQNIAKLRKRYPDGFDADKSINREE